MFWQSKDFLLHKIIKAERMLIILKTTTLIRNRLADAPQILNCSETKRTVLNLCGADEYSTADDIRIASYYDVHEIYDEYPSGFGYIVTYEIGVGFYAIVAFDRLGESSKFYVELIDCGASLLESNEYLI